MKRTSTLFYLLSGLLFLLFVLLTICVCRVDVRPIGPQHSSVGFASVNQFIFGLVGVHPVWQKITQWLGFAAMLVAVIVAAAGLRQLLTRKRLCAVDRRFRVLGILYGLMVFFYVFFELIVINCRPVMLEQSLEASYPSTHVMIVVFVLGTAVILLRSCFPVRTALCFGADLAAGILCSVTVIGRLLSGVHWFTDLAGGLLLSASLVTFFRANIESADRT